MVTIDVACVNREEGCRCDFVRLLRNVLVLMEQRILRATTKYVLSSIDDTATGESRTIATLQVFVQLHERLETAKATSLRDFELVLSHLQSVAAMSSAASCIRWMKEQATPVRNDWH
ncbi:hypothetical protein P43SY_010935 [Pythium insidiosum]|uniref:Uncharacterized protein n=1 Tax=Pythium insidiosum TaxID=114742 RepID=A0AAD5LXZ0_PYTIN|nr:hypothetical protein P43SY_010935 [Pythium insidiosum]